MNYELHLGDALTVLRTMPDASVQTCVTSPPYFGLRDYQTAKWEGGDAECDHAEKLSRQDGNRETPGGRGGSFRTDTMQYRDTCGKCGAIRIDSQIGLEPTPAAYVAALVGVFAEVWRVLRDDGTLWLNLGDSYSRSGGFYPDAPSNLAGSMQNGRGAIKGHSAPEGFKTKNLLGIPWRVAFALQEFGYYLRSDIIWHKPNPMPESVTDRPTKSHEYLFLLTKSPVYYYDNEAIKEPYSTADPSSVSYRKNGKSDSRSKHIDLEAESIVKPAFGNDGFWHPDGTGRNKRSVWTCSTTPFRGAHFATFPPKLITPCILAGSRIGDTVLDPFNGSGTTGAVALEHGRNYVGIELNPAYIDLARARIEAVQPTLEAVHI